MKNDKENERHHCLDIFVSWCRNRFIVGVEYIKGDLSESFFVPTCFSRADVVCCFLGNIHGFSLLGNGMF